MPSHNTYHLTCVSLTLDVGYLFTAVPAKRTGEPRRVSRVVAGFSSFDGEYSLPHVLAQGSPIFHSSFKGELGIALESLQGKIDLI